MEVLVKKMAKVMIVFVMFNILVHSAKVRQKFFIVKSLEIVWEKEANIKILKLFG